MLGPGSLEVFQTLCPWKFTVWKAILMKVDGRWLYDFPDFNWVIFWGSKFKNFQGKIPYQKGRDGLPVPSFLRELSLNFGGAGEIIPARRGFFTNPQGC